MIRVVLPVLLLLLGLGGGIGAGMLLGGGEDTAAAEPEAIAAPAGDPAEADMADESDQVTSAEDSGFASDAPVRPGSAENLEYVRLNNQFVVPVVRDAAVRSLVVMSLTVEIEAGQAEMVFNREPRLRDAFLRVMFGHANAGGFEGVFTTPTALNPLRSGLRDAAYDVLGPIVNDVLIVDIVRQDA
ncbi:MAG: flagellar basal body-associated FliL family protein [Pseudomonadota bacterium]